MDQATNDRISKIETEVRYLDDQIADLRQKRETLLRQDYEYSQYLDAWQDRGEGTNPLSIRQFYAVCEELEAYDKRIEAGERVNWKSIERLEALVLA